jgi:hypothetical protein
MALQKLADPEGVPDELLGKLYSLLTRSPEPAESSGE